MNPNSSEDPLAMPSRNRARGAWGASGSANGPSGGEGSREGEQENPRVCESKPISTEDSGVNDERELGQLVERFRSYSPQIQTDLLEKAFRFSCKVHQDQRRASK